MFEATRLTFYYAVTPVHMGAGSAIGAIDNPIQREVHTQHPVFAGSGIKGALRHHFTRAWPRDNGKPDPLITRIFGPETSASEFAGALSLTDAHLVVLPVRALKRAYAYATCPIALARLRRFARLAAAQVNWDVPSIPENRAVTAGAGILSNGRLVVEAFEFGGQLTDEVSKIGDWLAKNAFGGVADFFAKKLTTDLVVLSDTDFAHFARHAMVVEPHVRINESGTADEGGLFYTENLPPESILAGLAQASVERFGKEKKPEKPMDADDILKVVFDGNGKGPSGIAGRPLRRRRQQRARPDTGAASPGEEGGLSMKQTLDQQRAAFAWDCAQHGVAKFAKEYKSLAKGAPALIMNSGLMPILAFFKAKSDAANIMTDDMIRWLFRRLKSQELERGEGVARFSQFMQELHTSDSDTYKRATDDALEILKWIRQFVDAVPQGGD